MEIKKGEQMIVQGSINYTPSGRKMKRPWQTRRRQVWHWRTVSMPVYREDENKYPSAKLGSPVADETAKKKYYTSSHTIAPAYNKGAYQVISKENIKDIGR